MALDFGCLHIWDEKCMKVPKLADQVYKDECCLCYENQESEGGVLVCMTCFQGYCEDHATLHHSKSSHPLFLVIKKRRIVRPEEPPAKISKLAIGIEGGALDPDAESNFTYTYTTRCFTCPKKPETGIDQGVLNASARGIIEAQSAARREELGQWNPDITPCTHTRELVQPGAPQDLPSRGIAHCDDCALTSNMWLCLTCGHVGCGRPNPLDNSGGNGHAMAHHASSGHPVVVKMGTITPEGDADIYCYACDDEKRDDRLQAHLHHFGINVATQVKTEKSMAELNLDNNLKFDWSRLQEEGKKLVPVFGPGFTGLHNLGNSCYMASVMQVLFTLPDFQERYHASEAARNHFVTCRESNPAKCFFCQTCKLANGLLSGAYSKKEEAGASASSAVLESDVAKDATQKGITPRMFKSLIGKNHPEFSTNRQQDALEFFQYMVEQVERNERSAAAASSSSSSSSAASPASAMQYIVAERIQCLECNSVRVSSRADNTISVPIPLTPEQLKAALPKDAKKSAAAAAAAPADESPVEDVRPHVPMNDCITSLFTPEEVEGFKCPKCKHATRAVKSNAFATFPDVLVVHARRFVFDGWLPKKLDVFVDTPDHLELDPFKGSLNLLPGEEAMPQEEASAAAAPQFDESVVSDLMGMGFSRPRCIDAAVKSHAGKSVDVAMAYLLEHMDDPSLDIEAPVAAAAGPAEAALDEESIMMLSSMGFSIDHAKKALKACAGNMERAADWLFSHPEGADDDMDMSGGAAAAAPAAAGLEHVRDGPGRYQLFGLVSHMGSSTAAGHYVAHILKDVDASNLDAAFAEGSATGKRWVLFNDSKVAESQSPPKDMAYLYFFRRI